MECPRCGEPIDIALLRCQACGHDMLPQDITQRPATNGPSTPSSEQQFADAVHAVQQAVVLVESPEALAARLQRARRDQRLVMIFLAVATGLALLLSSR